MADPMVTANWGEWTPGKGVERLRAEMPGVMPDLTEEDYAAAEAIIAAAVSDDDAGEPVGSAPLSEEPTPPPVLPVEGFDQHVPVFTDVECPQCDGGRCDCFGKQVKICAADDEDWPCPPVAAYARGISEATEGWEREWSVRYNDRYVLGLKFTEGGAKRRAEDEDGKAVSRLVGPWEPAEQPESRVRTGYQCAIGGEACPGHSSKWLMCDPATRTEGEVKIRPRMTDGCGPEHTYRDGCELRPEGGAR